jgi:hypothetical protein
LASSTLYSQELNKIPILTGVLKNSFFFAYFYVEFNSKLVHPNQEGVFDMAKPKHKSTRNVPEMYEEIKKSYGLSLTPTAVNSLDYNAKKIGLSRSEFVEQFARSLEHLPDHSPTQSNP